MALSLIPGQHLPLPGTCVSCGSHGIDMIDTGVNQQFYGALLICVACFRDGALRITELNLFNKSLHDDIVADLEEKIEWRKSLEPTIAKLERDLASALSNARNGFSQRYLDNDTFDEIQRGTETTPKPLDGDLLDTGEADTQLFFTVKELGLVDAGE